MTSDEFLTLPKNRKITVLNDLVLEIKDQLKELGDKEGSADEENRKAKLQEILLTATELLQELENSRALD